MDAAVALRRGQLTLSYHSREAVKEARAWAEGLLPPECRGKDREDRDFLSEPFFPEFAIWMTERGWEHDHPGARSKSRIQCRFLYPKASPVARLAGKAEWEVSIRYRKGVWGCDERSGDYIFQSFRHVVSDEVGGWPTLGASASHFTLAAAAVVLERCSSTGAQWEPTRPEEVYFPPPLSTE